MVPMGMESSPMSDESQCGVCCSAGLKTGWQESTPSLDLKTKEHNGTVSYGEYLRQREKFIISIFIKCPGVTFCLVNAWGRFIPKQINWKDVVDPFGVVAIYQWFARQPASHCQMVCSKRDLWLVTPWKLNMEPEDTPLKPESAPLEKENHLPPKELTLPREWCSFSFRWAFLWETLFSGAILVWGRV